MKGVSLFLGICKVDKKRTEGRIGLPESYGKWVNLEVNQNYGRWSLTLKVEECMHSSLCGYDTDAYTGVEEGQFYSYRL